MTATLMDMAVLLVPDRWGLTANEKSVLVQLGRCADYRGDEADVGMPYIATRTGLSVDTVRRCMRALADGGWLAILPQDRPNGATSSNRYVLNSDQIINSGQIQRNEDDDYRAQWRNRFAKAPSTVQGGAGSTVPGGPLQPARGMLPDNNSNNSLSDAQARNAFEKQVMDAAGEAADPTAPGIITTYPLMALMQGDSPCTELEVIEGVRKAAAWFMGRHGAGKMRNWDMAARMAVEHRNLRLSGPPVREPPKPRPAGAVDDPKTFSRDKWMVIITRVAPKTGGWHPEWGPPPGAEGSLVPADLVDLWKGEAA